MTHESMNDMLQLINKSGKETYKCPRCVIINERDRRPPRANASTNFIDYDIRAHIQSRSRHHRSCFVCL